MKKIVTLSLIVGVVAFLTNCSPKTGKKLAQSDTKEKPKAEEPATTRPASATQSVTQIAQGERSNEEQLALLTQMNATRIESGKQLYESTCNKCHELHRPSKRSGLEWVEIMKTMGPKAKIEQGTYRMISAYLVKNSKA